MSRVSAVLIVYAALSATTGLAHAGACANQITQLRQAVWNDARRNRARSGFRDLQSSEADCAAGAEMVVNGFTIDMVTAARRQQPAWPGRR